MKLELIWKRYESGFRCIEQPWQMNSEGNIAQDPFFTDPQRDDALHGGQEVEELPYPGGGYSVGALGSELSPAPARLFA